MPVRKYKNIEGIPNGQCAVCFAVSPITRLQKTTSESDMVCQTEGRIFGSCEDKYYKDGYSPTLLKTTYLNDFKW